MQLQIQSLIFSPGPTLPGGGVVPPVENLILLENTDPLALETGDNFLVE